MRSAQKQLLCSARGAPARDMVPGNPHYNRVTAAGSARADRNNVRLWDERTGSVRSSLLYL